MGADMYFEDGRYQKMLEERKKIKEIEKKHSNISEEKISLSDGLYDGVAGGYWVKLDGYNLYFKLKDGIRGINIRVLIAVKDKIAYIK